MIVGDVQVEDGLDVAVGEQIGDGGFIALGSAQAVADLEFGRGDQQPFPTT